MYIQYIYEAMHTASLALLACLLLVCLAGSCIILLYYIASSGWYQLTRFDTSRFDLFYDTCTSTVENRRPCTVRSSPYEVLRRVLGVQSILVQTYTSKKIR